MRKFHFASICNVLPCELRLFWYSTGILNRHLANKLPTYCQQSLADCWPTVGRQFFGGAVLHFFRNFSFALILSKQLLHRHTHNTKEYQSMTAQIEYQRNTPERSLWEFCVLVIITQRFCAAPFQAN